MGEEILSQSFDASLWELAIESGVSFLVVVALFVGTLVWGAGKLGKYLKEAARLHGRAQIASADAVTSLADSQSRTAVKIEAMRSALMSQPDRWALRKDQLAMNGGRLTLEERKELESSVAAADKNMDDESIWKTHDDDELAPIPELEKRIDIVERDIDFCSDRDHRERLRRKLGQLQALREKL